MSENRTVLAAVFLCMAGTPQAFANDFPTQARVEFVLGCMAANGGQKYENLYACVCVIDRIAAKISYDEYLEGEVFTQLRGTPGERSGVFRDPDRAKLLVTKLSEISKVAEETCFVSRKKVAVAGESG